MAIYKGLDLIATKCDCCYYNIDATTAVIADDRATIQNAIDECAVYLCPTSTLKIPTIPTTVPGAMWVTTADCCLHVNTSQGTECKYLLTSSKEAGCYADNWMCVSVNGTTRYLPLYDTQCMNGVVEAFRIRGNNNYYSPGKWVFCRYTAYEGTGPNVSGAYTEVVIPARDAKYGKVGVVTYSGVSGSGIHDAQYFSNIGPAGFLSWANVGGYLFTTVGGWPNTWDGGNSVPPYLGNCLYSNAWGAYNGVRVFGMAAYPISQHVDGVCHDYYVLGGGENVSALIYSGSTNCRIGCIYNCGGYPTVNRWPAVSVVFTEGTSGLLQGPWDINCAITSDWRTGAGYINGWPWHSIPSGETSTSWGNVMRCECLQSNDNIIVHLYYDGTNNTTLYTNGLTYGCFNTNSVGGTTCYWRCAREAGGLYSANIIKSVNDWAICGHMYAGEGNMWVGDHANPACSYCNGVPYAREYHNGGRYMQVYAYCRVFVN